MKKITALSCLALLGFSLLSCTPSTVDYYTDDAPLDFALSSERLKILQVTDLHMSYGIGYNDQRTLNLIKAMALQEAPDIIVITGDMSMSPQGPVLFSQLYRNMERLGIPWTFIFGNHETDTNDYSKYLSRVQTSSTLFFKVGPEMTDGGYGNFIIHTTFDGNPFYNLYLMDSHTEDEPDFPYDHLSAAQVAWYTDHAEQDDIDGIDSIAFMHIPLMQYTEYEDYTLVDGAWGEAVCNQGVDTGFFDAVVAGGVTKGIFAGHDHLNNYSFMKEGVLLAYGNATGYNGYGTTPKGGRIIEIGADKSLTSYVILDSEVL